MQDLRFALRQLIKAPGFTAVAVLTLALGIGASTAIFSVINGVLLRPLPYDQPEELMRLYHRRSSGLAKSGYAGGGFFSVRQDNRTFATLAAWFNTNFSLAPEGAEPEIVAGAQVTEDFFATLRITPLLGRTFRAEEFSPGGDNTVLISHALWQQRFGGVPDILGRTVLIGGRNREIAGVLPDLPALQGKPQMWAPFAPNEFNRNRRDLHNLQVLGRLKAGVTYQQAQSDLALLTERYSREFATTDKDWTCLAFPMLADAVEAIRPALVVLVASVTALLLIACANVTNLLLARAAVRQREISIRAALGATRGRLVRQLVTEYLLLFLLGGAGGLLLGHWLLAGLLALAPANIPRLDQIGIDLRVLLFTSGCTFLTGLVFGLIPAWNASRTNLTLALREGHGAVGGRGWLRHALVVVQIAAAMVLLASAGLLIRSFQRLQQVDAGFNPTRVMTMKVDLPSAKYGTAEQPGEKRVQFVNELTRRLQALPDVEAAAIANTAPMVQGPTFIMRVDDHPDVTVSTAPVTRYRTITPDYFKVMGMTLLRGRSFTAQDVSGTQRVVIINQAFAKKFFPGVDNPLGRRVEVALDDPPRWAVVVGVVADAKIDNLEVETPVQAYEPYHEFAFNSLTLVVRTRGDPTALATAMRREVLAIDPQQPVHTQKTMERIVSDTLGPRYFSLLLVGVFAAVALLLASIGLYGVISYGVAQRTREFGVRLAIGANRSDILRLVLGQGGRLIGLGLLLGLIGALLSARLIQSLLFGISARDPLTLAVIAVILATVAFLACLIPALRATKVDPMIALRSD